MTDTNASEPTGVQVVAGPEALPDDAHTRTTYIVSNSDPHYLIKGRSGVVYVREDGQPWEGDGYHVSRATGSARTNWVFASRKLD